MTEENVKRHVLAAVAGMCRQRQFEGRAPICVTYDEVFAACPDLNSEQIHTALHELQTDGDVRIRPAINQMTIYYLHLC